MINENMIYEKEFKEFLGSHLVEYFVQIETQLELKLKNQLNGVISTRSGDFKMVKYINSNVIDINWGDKKILKLFSSEGCRISGKILIKLIAEVPGTDGNLSKPYNFEVNFINTNIIYDTVEELFTVEGDIEISFISLKDNHF